MMNRDYKTPVGAAPPDWRGLCEELVDALDSGIAPERILNSPTANRAREALFQAEPEVVGPTDEDCWQWYTYCPEEGLDMYSNREQAQSVARSIMGSYEVAAHSDGWHEDMESVSWGMLVPVEQAQVVERKTADPDSEFDEWVKYELRTARWGRPAPAPAEGEVAELVDRLRRASDGASAMGWEQDSWIIARAAALLEQRHPAPVPVAERLPGPEDCDAEGRVWLYRPQTPILNPYWDLVKLDYIDPVPPTHWLPAHALPLPQGEVE